LEKPGRRPTRVRSNGGAHRTKHKDLRETYGPASEKDLKIRGSSCGRSEKEKPKRYDVMRKKNSGGGPVLDNADRRCRDSCALKRELRGKKKAAEGERCATPSSHKIFQEIEEECVSTYKARMWNDLGVQTPNKPWSGVPEGGKQLEGKKKPRRTDSHVWVREDNQEQGGSKE